MDMFIGIALKLIIGSLAIFVVLRVIGIKAMSEVTPFDLLYIVVLGALLEEAIYDNQVSIFHILFGITLWGVMVYIVEKILERSEKLSSLIQGEPSVLIEKGKLNLKELKRNHYDMEQLRSVLRANDVYSINDVYYAILEVSGKMAVITKEQMIAPTYLLLEDGNIKPRTLASINQNEAWLRTKLSEKGYEQIEDLIYVEWDLDEKELIVEPYSNTISKEIIIDD